MSNLKISQLPEYSGNTSGSWLIMNNSGETTTYKVKKENWVFPYNGNATITGSLNVSGSGTFRSSTSKNTISSVASTILDVSTSSTGSVLTGQDLSFEGRGVSKGLINEVTQLSIYGGNIGITGSLNLSGSGTSTVQSDIVYISGSNGAVLKSPLTTVYASTLNTIDAPINIITASNYNRIIGTTQITGSLTVTGSVQITGSVGGNIVPLTISSNTASLDLSKGTFYTLQLVSGSNTFINPTNIQPGYTVNVLINTTGSATVSFPSSVKQISGSSYVPTTTTGKDVLSLATFDNSSVYLVSAKNLL
jgi:hypothetical protein